MPIYTHGSFYPPGRPEDGDSFFAEPTEEIEGAIFTPGSGYVSDPELSTHNVKVAAEAHGAEFLFNEIVVEIRRDEGESPRRDA